MQTQSPHFKASIFWKLCCVYDNIVIHTIIRYCSFSSNEFWDSIRDILDSSGILYHVLAEELKAEVINAKEIQTLFRVNSGPTLLLSSVLRKELLHIVEKYINPMIQFCNNEEAHIDSSDESVKQKSIDFINKCIDVHSTRFIQIASEMPENVRAIFGTIKSLIDETFGEPELTNQILSALFFHKIITPAIVTPGKFNSAITMPTEKGKNNLMLLSKIYQTMVNQSEEPFPEGFNLSVFNETIVNTYPKINEMIGYLGRTSTIPEYHFNKVVSSQLLLRRVPIILNTLETMKPNAIASMVQPLVDIGFKSLIENLLALTNINIYCKELARYDLKKPRNVGIFFDETEEECYNSVITGYEDTIHLYQKKINLLTEEVFRLNQIIEKFDTKPEAISEVYLNIASPALSSSPEKGPNQSNLDDVQRVIPTSGKETPLRINVNSTPTAAKKQTIALAEFNLPEMNEEMKNRFISITSKENQIYDLISKSDNLAALMKSEKFLSIYHKATKLKLKEECPKITQKDKDGGKDSKNKSIKDKEKDKQITKIKKSSLMELKESHENRLQLLLHIDDPKLTQRIASLMSILDDIIFVLTN